MNVSDWTGWLTQWLKRHPVKQPSEEFRQGYAQEVMSRIRELEGAAPLLRWKPQPRLAPRWSFALATAAACALLAVVVSQRSPDPAVRLEQKQQLLAQVDEIEAELELLEQLESEPPPAEEAPLRGTSLDKNFEEAPLRGFEEEWLEELRQLDEWELEEA